MFIGRKISQHFVSHDKGSSQKNWVGGGLFLLHAIVSKTGKVGGFIDVPFQNTADPCKKLLSLSIGSHFTNSKPPVSLCFARFPKGKEPFHSVDASLRYRNSAFRGERH